jgi:hypothetical protein
MIWSFLALFFLVGILGNVIALRVGNEIYAAQPEPSSKE